MLNVINESIFLNKITICVSEYAGNLGELGDKEWRAQEQQHILNLVDKFWFVTFLWNVDWKIKHSEYNQDFPNIHAKIDVDRA